LNTHAGIAIAAVVVLSLVLPMAWVTAPRLRARYWRQQRPAALPRF
jgi:hypothetical protein